MENQNNGADLGGSTPENQYTNYDPNQQQAYNQQNSQQFNQQNNQQFNQQNNQQFNQQFDQQNNQQYYQPQQQYNVPPPGVIRKSKIAGGLLGIFLGTFGVHNFYLGYTGKAVAQLLITVLTCGIGSPISAIWGLIEGILILTGSIAVDGQGVPLGD